MPVRATCSMAIALPRRKLTSAVTIAFAPASLSRAATACAPKPEKIGTTIAPILAHARNAITASGTIGRNKPTASPWPSPSRSSALASRQVSAWSSA